MSLVSAAFQALGHALSSTSEIDELFAVDFIFPKAKMSSTFPVNCSRS